MHVTLEELLQDKAFDKLISDMVCTSGRGQNHDDGTCSAAK